MEEEEGLVNGGKILNETTDKRLDKRNLLFVPTHVHQLTCTSGLGERYSVQADALDLPLLFSKFASVRLDYGDIERGTTSLAFCLA